MLHTVRACILTYMLHAGTHVHTSIYTYRHTNRYTLRHLVHIYRKLAEERLKVATEGCGLAEAELVVLKVNKAPASEIAEGQR